MTDKNLLAFEGASDAVAVVAALLHGKDQDGENYTDEAIETIMAIVRGKNYLEIMSLVVQLGGFAREMLESVARFEDEEPEEALRKMALHVQSRRPEAD